MRSLPRSHPPDRPPLHDPGKERPFYWTSSRAMVFHYCSAVGTAYLRRIIYVLEPILGWEQLLAGPKLFEEGTVWVVCFPRFAAQVTLIRGLSSLTYRLARVHRRHWRSVDGSRAIAPLEEWFIIGRGLCHRVSTQDGRGFCRSQRQKWQQSYL